MSQKSTGCPIGEQCPCAQYAEFCIPGASHVGACCFGLTCVSNDVGAGGICGTRLMKIHIIK